jgi:hypothetical protein
MSKFKVGDIVELTATQAEMSHKNAYRGNLTKGQIGKITEESYGGYLIDDESRYCYIDGSQLKLVTSSNAPHVHAELIRAWADGTVIQKKGEGVTWFTTNNPQWYVDSIYRIKPEVNTEVESHIQDMQNVIDYLTTEIEELRKG